MRKIFEEFADLLDKRLEEKVPTTEDSVRYTLFASMLQNKIDPNEIELEHPHPMIDGAQIDTWLRDFGGNPVGIEFKYDRPAQGTSKAIINKTERAGAVFEDLRRLQLLTSSERPVECYLVYVTSEEMNKYFNSQRNCHVGFYCLSPGYSFDIESIYFKDRPDSFLKKIKGAFEARVTGVLSRDISREHYLRVYRVCSL
ncbi:MAG: hypothetical protein OXI17_11305 [Gammaproteobacteria bacterium]|nr:hypothetical protein [Gammaproteobacteria bacterium]